MVDIPGNSSTTRTIAIGGSISDVLETRGDHDWIRIQLTAAHTLQQVDRLTAALTELSDRGILRTRVM